MKLYEYAVIFTPRAKGKDGERAKAELVVDVTRVLANSDKEATMLAARAIPDKYADKLEQVEIAVRPF